MATRLTELADGVHQLTTVVADMPVAASTGDCRGALLDLAGDFDRRITELGGNNSH